MGDYEINHEDVHMKLFLQTLDGDARDWFSFLLVCAISYWGELHSTFMEKFGERVSIFDCYRKCLKIHIESDELVPQFNIKLTKVLNEIYESYRPNDQMCLAIHFNAFDKKMNYLLKDKEPRTLYQALMTSMDFENNLKYRLIKGHFSRNVC